jgi:hypothetical protein
MMCPSASASSVMAMGTLPRVAEGYRAPPSDVNHPT